MEHKKLEQAFELIKQEAELGNLNAMYDLGWLMYHEGIGTIAVDDNKAIEWLIKASQLGHIEAKFKLSYMYSKGIGVPTDAYKSFKLILDLAEEGHSYAQYKVGLFYLDGYGTNKNLEQALEWISQAAKQGSTEAYEFLKRHRRGAD